MMEEDLQWDAMLLPANAFDFHDDSFLKNVVPVCNERGIGATGLKAFARSFKPLTPAEIYARHAEAIDIRQKIHIEKYKDGHAGCDWHMENILKQPKDSIG